jgi:acyl dehydratase
MGDDHVRTADLETGARFGPGRWFTIDRERVDNFADSASDLQWIHRSRAPLLASFNALALLYSLS